MAAFADTWRSTLFNEAFNPASPNEAWSIDQGRATRVIHTAWATRKQAALDFMGYAEILDNGGLYLSRSIPVTYPGEDYVWCTGVPKVSGIGSRGKTGSGGSMLADYEIAEMTLAFSTPLYEIFDDDTMVSRGYIDANGNPDEGEALKAGDPRYISVVTKPGMQTLTFNRALIKRSDNGNPLSEGFPIQVPHTDLEFTWHFVPKAAMNWSAWGVCMGKINEDTFYGFEPETLLMESPEVIPFRGPFGDMLYNVKFRARYKPQFDTSTPPVAKGWNYILAPTGNGATAALAMVKVAVNGTTGTSVPYQTADFSTCFAVPTP